MTTPVPVVVISPPTPSVVIPGAIESSVVVIEGATPAPVIVSPQSGPVVVPGAQEVGVTIVWPQGPQGPPGPSGDGATIAYDVTSVSSWTQVHSFLYQPMVRLVDASGELVLISAEYPDSTHVHVSFPTPFTGTILLS